MRRTLRQNALALSVVSFAFCLFFQTAKHAPRFSVLNPFADDPYDSVGSFAIQFALFMVLLSLFRAFRRRPPDAGSAVTQIRGQLMGYCAIAFTLVADLIALLRHGPMWIATRTGDELLALTACLLLWTLAAAVLLLFTARSLSLSPLRAARLRIVLVPAIAVIVLAFYPESLRRTLAGEIVTVLCGMALLFLVVWAIGTAVVPHLAAAASSDLVAVGQQSPSEKSGGVARWLSTRSLRWALAAVVGILCGTFLVLRELADGASPHGARRLLVIVVYLAIETTGVLTGFALLAEPLSLFPRE